MIRGMMRRLVVGRLFNIGESTINFDLFRRRDRARLFRPNNETVQAILHVEINEGSLAAPWHRSSIKTGASRLERFRN
jgi:hypothetical protein